MERFAINQKEIQKILCDLGLKKTEGKIYFYLSKRGPKKATEIASALNMTRQHFYQVVKSLQNKGIVTVSFDRPAQFFALPFDKTLEIIANAKLKDAKTILKNKETYLSSWQLIKSTNDQKDCNRFTIVKGRNYAYSKIIQMIKETKNHFSLILDPIELLFENQFGVFDEIQNNEKNSKIKIRIITELLNEQHEALTEFSVSLGNQSSIRGRDKTRSSVFPRMVIKDEKEILYFLTSNNKNMENSNFVCLHTDCDGLVEQFSNVFEEIWKVSKGIEQNINQTFGSEEKSLQTDIKTDLDSSEKETLAPYNILKMVSYLTKIEKTNPSSINEKDIINKILSAEKNPNLHSGFDGYHSYASSGLAVIRFPKVAKIPDLLIRPWHFDKKSVFGTGDVLMFHLWLDGSNGSAFVPVALVHDQLELTDKWKKWLINTPASNNVQLVEKNQIQVQTYGETLFASWTQNIPILNKKYVLPPSTLILEGYGDVLSGTFTQIFPSGVNSRAEFNGFEANVTLIQGKTKFSGSPVGGFVFRELLIGNPKQKS
ncbi:MAG: helix-turn-helix domain-containing protein [Candidatus Bathyarchaeota archaeon]